MTTGHRRWLLAAAATVLAAGVSAGLLGIGVMIGHRYSTVRAAFTDRTRTVIATQTRTVIVTSSPVVVVTRPVVNRPVIVKRTVTPVRTVTQAQPTVTQTVTATPSFSQ